MGMSVEAHFLRGPLDGLSRHIEQPFPRVVELVDETGATATYEYRGFDGRDAAYVYSSPSQLTSH